MKHVDLAVAPWEDYELLDSGGNRKLERFGPHIIIRPETQALWQPLRPELWRRAAAEFRFDSGKGSWQKKNIPDTWQMQWNDLRFTAKLTSFKHTGVFPEQAENWRWIAERCAALRAPAVLNLFGYTGIASMAAAKAGARVTHVDASKQSNTWAKENAALSGIPPEQIRFLLDDAVKFVEREKRRGAVYDGVILDPPAFGRGPEGEVWKIEEDFPRLLAGIKAVLAKKPGTFFLLNGYAAGYAPQSFLQAVQGVFPEMEKMPHAEFGELRIQESKSNRCVPSGIYVRAA